MQALDNIQRNYQPQEGEMEYESLWKQMIHKFTSNDFTRISIATGASRILDAYIDKRQKDCMKKIVNNDSMDLTLDAGMGAGRWTEFFTQRSNQVMLWGVDLQHFNNNLWEWVEYRGGYLQRSSEIVLKSILFMSHPFNLVLSEGILKNYCDEKIFVFEKNS
jgi:hypothetical protein